MITNEGRKRKKYKTVSKFLSYYIFAVTLFTFVILECSIRLFNLAPSLPPRYTEFVKDSILPFKAAPNSIISNLPWPKGHEFQFEFRTNSLGFRDIEHPFRKAQGIFRILALGDSFTMGAGARYEGTYPYQLQELFNKRSGNHPRVEVINAGQCRYWPEPERILLETIGVKFKPDIILVAFNVGDVSDTYEGINFAEVRKGYLVTREAYELGDIGIWCYTHSHLFRKIAKIYLNKRLKNIARSSEAKASWNDIFIPNGSHEKDWLQIELEYEKMRNIAHKINARLAIVYIPLQRENQKYPLERLITWGRKCSVLVIDPVSSLREAAKHQQVYWNEDVHCTEAGYRVIAETIYMKLTEMQMVP